MIFRLTLDGEIAQAAETMTFTPDAIYGSPINPVVINLDNATGIGSAQSSTFNAQSVYDLSGRRVESSMFNGQRSVLKSGVYIINGEKKAVK